MLRRKLLFKPESSTFSIPFSRNQKVYISHANSKVFRHQKKVYKVGRWRGTRTCYWMLCVSAVGSNDIYPWLAEWTTVSQGFVNPSQCGFLIR